MLRLDIGMLLTLPAFPAGQRVWEWDGGEGQVKYFTATRRRDFAPAAGGMSAAAGRNVHSETSCRCGTRHSCAPQRIAEKTTRVSPTSVWQNWIKTWSPHQTALLGIQCSG